MSESMSRPFLYILFQYRLKILLGSCWYCGLVLAENSITAPFYYFIFWPWLGISLRDRVELLWNVNIFLIKNLTIRSIQGKELPFHCFQPELNEEPTNMLSHKMFHYSIYSFEAFSLVVGCGLRLWKELGQGFGSLLVWFDVEEVMQLLNESIWNLL